MLTLKTTGLQAQTQITLEKVVNEWSFYSPSAEKIRLTYDNISMTHKKYLKGFLPLITININPVSFNHSLRLMQNSTDGSYSYVNDYSNTSNTGLTIQQKIGITQHLMGAKQRCTVM